MKSSEVSPYATHESAWELLPWYANGTLKGDELDLVRRHLQVCVTCRKELTLLRIFAEAICDSRSLDLSPRASFSRLMERIEDTPGGASPASPSEIRRVPGGRRTIPAIRAASFSGWRIAAAVMLATGLSLPLWLQKDSMTVDPEYRTLASKKAEAVPARGDIVVAFSESMTRAQMDALLVAIDGRIVDGPNVVGAYTVKLTPRSRAEPDIASVLGRLRQHAGIVMAEPVVGTKGRSVGTGGQ